MIDIASEICNCAVFLMFIFTVRYFLLSMYVHENEWYSFSNKICEYD